MAGEGLGLCKWPASTQVLDNANASDGSVMHYCDNIITIINTTIIGIIFDPRLLCDETHTQIFHMLFFAQVLNVLAERYE